MPFSNADCEHALKVKSVLEECIASSNNLLLTDPGRLLQTRYSMLASNLRSLAAQYYILSHPIVEVQETLSRSADAALALLASRHVFDKDDFSVEHIRVDSLGQGTIISSSDQEPDYSLTNSGDTYYHSMVALAAGKWSAAKAIADLIWDPPNAKYVKKTSGYCTPNHQRLAFALRSYFAPDIDACNGYLQSIRPPFREQRIRIERDVLASIASRDTTDFLKCLDELLEWWVAVGKRSENRRDPYFFICIPGLAYCKLAMKSCLISSDDIPEDVFILPKELLMLPDLE